MAQPPPPRSVTNALWNGAALIIIVAGMKEAESFLLPIMMAAMLAIIAAPAVRWLEDRRIPNVVAVLLVVVLMMSVVAGMGALVGGSVASFRENVPHYQKRLGIMVVDLFAWLQSHGLKLETSKLLEVVSPGEAAGKAMGYVGKSMNTVVSGVSDTILVVLTMILILMEGHTIPAKLRAMAGDPEADISHFQKIGSEVQSYLGIKTVLSLATGVVIWLWAAFLGVDFALLWGLLAFLLNYIPNIGSIIAAVPACLLALIQHGPGTALALLMGYVVANMVVGNVVEPMWMGKKLGLSTTVVFLSLVVWGWIWGPLGMLLSVPLTMVLKILLENSPNYQHVAILLGTGEDLELPPPSTERSAGALASLRAAVSRVSSRPPPPHVDTELARSSGPPSSARSGQVTDPPTTSEAPDTRPSAPELDPGRTLDDEDEAPESDPS